MNWTGDKIKHYRKGYAFGRYGSVIGFLVIALILVPGKELFDLIRKKHRFEVNDYAAGFLGAWHGLIRKKTKFPINQ
ncbi:MAG: hypothetical protein AB7U05_08895 [Mangrovibacterium sp.]